MIHRILWHENTMEFYPTMLTTQMIQNDESIDEGAAEPDYEHCHTVPSVPVFVCNMDERYNNGDDEFVYFYSPQTFTRSHMFVSLCPTMKQRVKIPHPNSDAAGFIVIHDNGANTKMIPAVENDLRALKHECFTRQLIKHLMRDSNKRRSGRRRAFVPKKSRFAQLSIS